MKIIKSTLQGIIIIEPDVFADSRGYFLESFSSNKYKEHGINSEFVQDNISKSVQGTIRGLHYQVGESVQGKLCYVVRGRVLDVAVDIRFNSPTFGKHASIELSEENHKQIWIPPGFAHGFSVLSDEAIFMYKCTKYYNKNDERSIHYNDPDLNIDWKIEPQIVSEKDKSAARFKDIKADFIFSINS